MLNFIYLDILQPQFWLIPVIFPDDDGRNDYALNPQFDMNGYSSMILIKNLGSTFVYLMINILLFPISSLMLRFGKNYSM